MNEIIKEIVSKYTGVAKDAITDNTKIDRNALGSSIAVHRMYAELLSNHIEVQNYREINDFKSLINKIASKIDGDVNNEVSENFEENDIDSPTIGIDIEQVASFHKTSDYRTDSFYTSNFSQSEIAHCVLQSDPILSFAGLFAAKEAVIKSDNSLRHLPFNQIVITHTESGKPIFRDFTLSIAHSEAYAVAVAVRYPNNLKKMQNTYLPESNTVNNFLFLISFTAIIACLVLFVILYCLIK
ncbi:MAG: 4'-phosphopantetheinyl transferase superfamily protein [Ferruginibacter sp.]|nr:4'-phosphopantetheinyl transferase superfamily protein [Ferruginibacter sp.]